MLDLDLEEEPINTTPMIDVVFNLLVFFMLTTTFLNEEQELQVQLPRVAAAAPLTDAPDEISVDVLANGGLVVGGKAVTPEELGKRLKAAKANYPDQVVAVRGHRSAAYESVVRAFAVARQAGISRVVARVLEERRQ